MFWSDTSSGPLADAEPAVAAGAGADGPAGSDDASRDVAPTGADGWTAAGEAHAGPAGSVDGAEPAPGRGRDEGSAPEALSGAPVGVESEVGSGPIDGAEPEAPPADDRRDDRDEEAGGADEVTTDGVATDGVTTDEVTTDEAFLSAVAAEFDAIEAALVRLDDGTFDSCQVCGGRIGQDRLMADPLLTCCPSHT